MAEPDAASDSGPRPWSIEELRAAYHWLYFRKPFPAYFPKEADAYSDLVTDLEPFGGRSASAIQQLLREKFGTPPHQDQVLLAYAALHSETDNWTFTRPYSGKLCFISCMRSGRLNWVRASVACVF